MPQNLAFVLGVKVVWKLWSAFWHRVEMNELDGRPSFEFKNVRPATRGIELEKAQLIKFRPASKRTRWWAPLTSYAPRPPS